MTLEFENEISIQPTDESGGGGGGGSDFIGIPRELNNGVLQMPSTPTPYTLPNGVTDIGDFAMWYAFYKCENIPTVDLSKLTTVSGQHALTSAFREAGVQSADISNLVSITGDYGMNSIFNKNLNLQTIEFPKLTTVGKRGLNQACCNCTSLTSISFPELTTVSGEYGLCQAFSGCTGLTTVTFPKLDKVTGKSSFYHTFENCTNITDIYFPALTTTSFTNDVGYGNTPLAIFNNSSTMRGKIHLPSNLSSITWINNSVGSSSYRQQYFGSDYCTVLLDLPATS